MTFGVLLVLVCALLYFLPVVIASSRKVANMGGIVAVNLLLGWTILGWVGALVWACSAETQEQAMLRTLAYQRMAGIPGPSVAPPAAAGPSNAHRVGERVGQMFHRD